MTNNLINYHNYSFETCIILLTKITLEDLYFCKCDLFNRKGDNKIPSRQVGSSKKLHNHISEYLDKLSMLLERHTMKLFRK